MNPRRQGGELQPHSGGNSLSLREAMSRLFDESLWDPFEEKRFGFSGSSGCLFPKVDISETDDEVKITANIPGIDPEKVNIEVDEESLVLSGTIEEEKEDSDARHYRYEREYGEFYRDFFIPSKVDPEKVSAESKNGVLVIKLPKVVDKNTRKKIDVKKRA